MISVNFVGTTGRDAEVKYTTNGKAVWSVNVASNYGYGENKKTMWLKLEAWDKVAEGYAKWNIKKGQKFYVSGELQDEVWTDKNGVEKRQNKVRVMNLEGVSPKDANAPAAPARSSDNTRHQERKADGYAPAAGDIDDDIPF